MSPDTPAKPGTVPSALVAGWLKPYKLDAIIRQTAGGMLMAANEAHILAVSLKGVSAERNALAAEVARLRKIVDAVPTDEPESYEGDNHGGTFSWGCAFGEWALAKKLLAALSAQPGATDEGKS